MNRVDAKRIRSIADRVERINEEIAGLNADKREIFAEARDAKYDVKALKTAIKIRQQKANDSAGFQEHEHLVELYLDALDNPEETGHARAPAPRRRDPSDHQETPAPITSPADGGLPHPSVPAEPPQTAASTSGSVSVQSSSASEGTQPAEIDISIPAFLKRDANNRAPFMKEGWNG